MPLLLIARYIPAPMGNDWPKRASILVDGIGNLHVNLGGDYYVFTAGRKEIKPKVGERRITAAMVQPHSLSWRTRTQFTGRTEAGRGGGGPARRRRGGPARLTETGVLHATRTGLKVADRKSAGRRFPRRI